MVSFRGSISNLPIIQRGAIILLTLMMPFIAVLMTLGLILTVTWWAIVLVFDLIVFIVSLSLSGQLFRGNEVTLDSDHMKFRKGWVKGRVHLRDLIKVYRVKARNRDAILMVFRDNENGNPRCLTVDQMFGKDQRQKLFNLLDDRKESFPFLIEDDAPMERIISEKRSLGWSPV